MESITQIFQQLYNMISGVVNACPHVSTSIKEAVISMVCIIPFLYVLYYIIERIEKYILDNFCLFLSFVKRLGAFFGVAISLIPECAYTGLTSVLYSRGMVSKGTLLAFFIATSDDALPFLFMDFSKIKYILPIVIIKSILAIVVAVVVDILFFFTRREADLNAINMDINVAGCCGHRISTVKDIKYGWKHPAVHTLNMFMFGLLTLIIINSSISAFGSIDNLANYLYINSPIQIIAVAIFSLIPNCAVSVMVSLLFVKGVISFPAFLSGMVSVTGLGLYTLAKHQKERNFDTFLIIIILTLVSIATGLAIYYGFGSKFLNF